MAALIGSMPLAALSPALPCSVGVQTLLTWCYLSLVVRGPPRICVWFVGCLTSQQDCSASRVLICSDDCTWYHTEIEAADHTFYPTHSQYTDTRPTSPSADPIMPGAWCHWNSTIKSVVWLDLKKKKKKDPRQSGNGRQVCQSQPSSRPFGVRSGSRHCLLAAALV